MVLEIGIPHMFPTFIVFCLGMMRWYDRGFTSDKSKSRKFLQVDYEELYVGSDFYLDARLAQVIAVIWATFIYSPALPLLYPIAVVNLIIIYWMDKMFCLRFNRTPKNYSEDIITKKFYFLKLTFLFHFIAGLILLSNNGILQSESVENKDANIRAINTWAVNTFGFNVLSD